jgi:hypothetical protein
MRRDCGSLGATADEGVLRAYQRSARDAERDRDVEDSDSSLTRHQHLLHACGAVVRNLRVPRAEAGVVFSGFATPVVFRGGIEAMRGIGSI